MQCPECGSTQITITVDFEIIDHGIGGRTLPSGRARGPLKQAPKELWKVHYDTDLEQIDASWQEDFDNWLYDRHAVKSDRDQWRWAVGAELDERVWDTDNVVECRECNWLGVVGDRPEWDRGFQG